MLITFHIYFPIQCAIPSIIKSITHLFCKIHANPDRIVQTYLHGMILNASFLFPIISSHSTKGIILTAIKTDRIQKHIFWHYFLLVNFLHNFCYFIIFCPILPPHNNNFMDTGWKDEQIPPSFFAAILNTSG